MELLVFVVGALFLGVAALQDFRTREVADTLSLGFLLFAVSYGVGRALLTESWQPLLTMLLGLGAMLLLGFLLYTTGQWGGADSKLLIALGALLGLGWDGQLLLYLLLALFVGALYGTCYTLVLAFRHRKKFLPRFRAALREPRVHKLRLLVVVTCFLLLLLIFLLPALRWPLALLLIILYTFFYLWLLVKTVETSILIKRYPVGKLTEGDWIQKDVFVKGKRVCGPKDNGITKEQIAQLKRLKVKSVMVKEGIPFVPSFFLAWLILWLWGSQLTTLVF